jgi:hypothetical protein
MEVRKRGREGGRKGRRKEEGRKEGRKEGRNEGEGVVNPLGVFQDQESRLTVETGTLPVRPLEFESQLHLTILV